MFQPKHVAKACAVEHNKNIMSRITMDLACLPKAAQLAPAGARNPRWHPGAQPALHSEIFAAADEAGGAGAALAFVQHAWRQGQAGQLQNAQPQNAQGQSGKRQSGKADRAMLDERAVLWVQDKTAIRRTGRPYCPGLPEYLRGRLIHVAASNAEDALFALEEGVRCRDLACVIGEIAGNPKALDFTASRRLSLAAEKHGVPLFLVRLDAQADLSSARMRWLVRSAPSAPPLWDRAAPGQPTWHAELFRARTHAPGEWVLRALHDSLSAAGQAVSRQSAENLAEDAYLGLEDGLQPPVEGPARRAG